MRAILATATAAAAVTAAGALAAQPVVVTMTAASHQPKIGAHWPYSVRATRAGKPVPFRITVQIVDPIGNAHPVTYANTKRPVVRLPFRGVFRDFLVWPPTARGVTLTLRVTVTAGGDRVIKRYAVTPVR